MNDWDDIRYFLSVSREGSVSGAAKVLGVNHSTVSRRIKGFEERHGVLLFNRLRDGYEMTESADAIFEQAQNIESQSEQISRTLFGQDARLEGPINLTMPHDIFEYCLAPELAQFNKKHPGIEINLMVTKGVRNLASREADLAIRLTPSPPDYLIGRQVSGLQHGVYVASHIDLTQPVGIIIWSGETELPEWANQYFPNAYISLKVDDLSSMYASVKAGFGVARMPCYMPDSIHDTQVVKLNIPIPRSDWSVWVLSHIDLRKTARIKKCRDFLIAAINKKRALFEGVTSLEKQ